jgi:hypothetical protein
MALPTHRLFWVESFRSAARVVTGVARRAVQASDTIVDFLDDWWRERKVPYPQVRTIMIDLDNGPQVASRRRQFI